MKKETLVNISDNYGKRLSDEIVGTTGLKGEVELQLRDKVTGDVQTIKKHNLIVYGGREWLLRKVFNTAINGGFRSDDKLSNSEIMWFGIGSGGGEPGNPLQCGCVYGSNDDLYNPIRMRYDIGNNNPYYASRIMDNGDVVSGYYKKISYVSIKEDLANPYKVNNITKYPNLIAELRLEISSDDCISSTYLEKDYEMSYCDVNEAGLFIADRRLSDPGASDKLTTVNTDYLQYDSTYKRLNLESLNTLPDSLDIKDGDSVIGKEWTTEVPYPDTYVQYFNVYKKIVSTQDEYDYTDGTTYYKLDVKLNDRPVLFGKYSGGNNTCTGRINLDAANKKLIYQFGDTSGELIFAEDGINTLDDMLILTHGTVVIQTIKSERLSNINGEAVQSGSEINVAVRYRNGFNVDFTDLIPESTLFADENSVRLFLPVGYSCHNGEIVNDEYFGLHSNVRVTQSSDIYREIVIEKIIKDLNSTECMIYVDNTTVKYLTEGMKIYMTTEDDKYRNYIGRNNPATITEVYDIEKDTSVVQRDGKGSYVVIDRKDLITEVYEGGRPCKVYREEITNPYTLWSRLTFSTVRLNQSRELVLIWRVYF